MHLSGHVVIAVEREVESDYDEDEDVPKDDQPKNRDPLATDKPTSTKSLETVEASEFGHEDGSGNNMLWVAFRDGYHVQVSASCRNGAVTHYHIACEVVDGDVISAEVHNDDPLDVHC